MKWLGAVVFVCACYLFGIKLSKDEEEKLKSLDALISLLNYMRRRIAFEQTPVFELFSSFQNEYLEKVGFIEEITRFRNLTNERWETALALMYLDTDIKDEFLRFGSELGTLSLESQLKRIDYVASVLHERLLELKTELPKKQKTAKTIALLVGLLTTIILI